MIKNRQSKFVPLPRHGLDHSQMVQATKALNSLLNGQIIIGTKAQIHYSDGNVVFEIPPGGTSVEVFQITAIDGSDSFSAQAWDGTNLSGPVLKIAKQLNFRTSLTSEVVDGVTIAHTFSDDNHRTSDDGVNIQNEICWPRFAVGNEVTISKSLNGTPVAGADYIDETDRVWMTY